MGHMSAMPASVAWHRICASQVLTGYIHCATGSVQCSQHKGCEVSISHIVVNISHHLELFSGL